MVNGGVSDELPLDAKSQYMRAVSRMRRLTEEEQRELAQRIERGKAERLRPCPDVQVLEDAQKAQAQFVASFQRLIVSRATLWCVRFRRLEWLDLVQEGNLALLRMMAQYDLSQVRAFGGLVAACLRNAFASLWRDREGLVQVPGNVVEAIQRLRRVQGALSGELGREPTLAEVAGALEISEQAVVSLDLADQQRQVESLQALLAEEGEEAEGRLHLVNCTAEAIGQDVARQEQLAGLVRQGMATVLTERQQQVVSLYYGLEGECQTFQRIGERFGVTYVSAQNAERAARERLRHALAVSYEALSGQALDGSYTAREAAARLGIAPRTFHTWVQQGKISRQQERWPSTRCYSQREIERLAAVLREGVMA